MDKRRKYNYLKETEAAWFAIHEFIDLNNCSTMYNDAVIQMNPNELLCHLYSKTRTFVPFTYSKRMYNLHLLQKEDHYYRSKWNARHRVGFGNSDKQAQRLIFAEDLGITCKVVVYNGYYIILLGIDIDAHNGEEDARRLGEWLKTKYFPDSYWEPSTHFKGMHGYVKIAYPDCLSLSHVTEVLFEVFRLLDQKRITLGFASSIDPPCGLPAQFYYNDSIAVPSSLRTITSKEYARYRQIRRQYEDKEITSTDVFINQYTSYNDIDDILQTPLPWTMKQSQCLKLPRFNATDHRKTSMVDIIEFYKLPFLSFRTFIKLRHELRKEFAQNPFVEVTTDSSSAKKKSVVLDTDTVTADLPPVEEDTALLKPEPDNQVTIPLNGGGRGKRPCNLVSSPNREQRVAGDSKEAQNTFEPSETGFEGRKGGLSKKIKRWNRSEKSYLAEIEKTKKIPNKAAMTNSFYVRYSDYLGRIASVDEAEDEYIRLGLNRTQGKGVKGRLRRLKKAKKFTEKLWETSRRGFSLNDWEKQKLGVVISIFNKVISLNRTWTKDAKLNRIYEIGVEELALIYYALCRSNELDDNAKGGECMRYAFSYRQLQDCYRLVYGQSCHRAKAGRILDVLKKSGLIEPVGSYAIGEHGNKYKAIRIDGSGDFGTSPGGVRKPSGASRLS